MEQDRKLVDKVDLWEEDMEMTSKEKKNGQVGRVDLGLEDMEMTSMEHEAGIHHIHGYYTGKKMKNYSYPLMFTFPNPNPINQSLNFTI